MVFKLLATDSAIVIISVYALMKTYVDYAATAPWIFYITPIIFGVYWYLIYHIVWWTAGFLHGLSKPKGG